jgi:hypothetical protein
MQAYINRIHINNCRNVMLDRAMRSRGPRSVFLWRGEFWRVRTVSYAQKRIELYSFPHARKSLDDCTPAEWDAASRAVRAHVIS